MRLRATRRATAVILTPAAGGEPQVVVERELRPGEVLDVTRRLPGDGGDRRDGFTAADGGILSLPAGSWRVDFHHEVRERLRDVVAGVVRAGRWTDEMVRKTRRTLDCARAVHPEVVPDHADYGSLAGRFIDAALGGDLTALPPPLADHVRRFRGR